jgi:hypothetical protein
VKRRHLVPIYQVLLLLFRASQRGELSSGCPSRGNSFNTVVDTMAMSSKGVRVVRLGCRWDCEREFNLSQAFAYKAMPAG